MRSFRVDGDRLVIGELMITFQRTLRIPDDGGSYPLPPGLGAFPIRAVEDYEDRVPREWTERPGVFIPMYQREAMWLSFTRPGWKPCALKVGVGRVNAVTGDGWNAELHADPQDYVVCPTQPWLDGIKQGDGTIRQFIAMPLGMGYTVEAQVTGKEEFGGIQLVQFEPVPGRFPDEPPPADPSRFSGMPLGGIVPSMAMPSAAPVGGPPPLAGTAMGLGAGGKMTQSIYPDPHGIDTWDQAGAAEVVVHIVDSLMFREITGEEPPLTPVTAKTYAQYGFPWFKLYDEHRGDLPATDTLRNVKPVREMDEQKGFAPMQDASIHIPPDVILGIDPDKPAKGSTDS